MDRPSGAWWRTGNARQDRPAVGSPEILTHCRHLTQPESAATVENEQAAQSTPAEDAAPPMEEFEVVAKADPKFNFSEIKTYAWYGATAKLNDPEGKWSVPDMDIGNEITFLIDRELRARGWTEVKETPNVWVTFAILFDMEAVLIKDEDDTLSFGETVPAGALYVALADGETEQAVWVGAASCTVDEKPQTETVKKRLDYSVSRIITLLPQ